MLISILNLKPDLDLGDVVGGGGGGGGLPVNKQINSTSIQRGMCVCIHTCMHPSIHPSIHTYKSFYKALPHLSLCPYKALTEPRPEFDFQGQEGRLHADLLQNVRRAHLILFRVKGLCSPSTTCLSEESVLNTYFVSLYLLLAQKSHPQPAKKSGLSTTRASRVSGLTQTPQNPSIKKWTLNRKGTL